MKFYGVRDTFKGYAGLMTTVCIGGYSYLFSVVNLNNVMINTFNYIKGMVWIVWLEAIINIVLSIILLRHFGLGGVALGTLLGTMLGPSILFPIFLKKRSNGMIVMNVKHMSKHFIIIILPFLGLSFLIHFWITGLLMNISATAVALFLYSFFSYIILPGEARTGLNLMVKSMKVFNKSC